MSRKTYAAMLFAFNIGIAGTFGATSSASSAEDCVVSTDLPPNIKSFPGITQHTLNEDRGFFGASLESGDQLTIFFDPCGLNLRANYFFSQDAPEEVQQQTIKQLFRHLLPSESLGEDAISEFSAATRDGENPKGKPVHITVGNNEYRISKNKSSSNLFEIEIHLEWIPPNH